MDKPRIELLDSFRFIAILCVLLYHYTERWSSMYPYGHSFHHIFSFGFLGVEFFFMISGFVISYTLENTPSLVSFCTNRFSRLFPPMVLCTIITYIVVRTLDNHFLFANAHKIKNFLPSLTFINPTIWTLLIKKDFAWINGSYWSLWMEIQFYAISSVVFFLNKKYFFRNILIVGMAVSISKYVPIYFLNSHIAYFHTNNWVIFLTGWKHGNELFNIPFFIAWFLPGVIFYQLYKGFRFAGHVFTGICAVAVIVYLPLEIQVWHTYSLYTHIACFIMLILFMLMIYKKKYLFFLENPILKRIGVISYSIYLIHETIGVLLINKYAGYLGSLSVLSPFIMIILATGFAELSYRFYERKASLLLKKIFHSQATAGNMSLIKRER